MLPEWAAGFWQCKLRYRTQEELLNVAREYKKKGFTFICYSNRFFFIGLCKGNGDLMKNIGPILKLW